MTVISDAVYPLAIFDIRPSRIVHWFPDNSHRRNSICDDYLWSAVLTVHHKLDFSTEFNWNRYTLVPLTISAQLDWAHFTSSMCVGIYV